MPSLWETILRGYLLELTVSKWPLNLLKSLLCMDFFFHFIHSVNINWIGTVFQVWVAGDRVVSKRDTFSVFTSAEMFSDVECWRRDQNQWPDQSINEIICPQLMYKLLHCLTSHPSSESVLADFVLGGTTSFFPTEEFCDIIIPGHLFVLFGHLDSFSVFQSLALAFLFNRLFS